MNPETNYRELAIVTTSDESKDPFGINPDIITQLLTADKAEKELQIQLPKLESLLFWQYRLKRETQKIKREYISMKKKNDYTFIHHFYLVNKRVSIITLYALLEFSKAGWNVKISNDTRDFNVCIEDFDSLVEAYNKFGKNSSLFIHLTYGIL